MLVKELFIPTKRIKYTNGEELQNYVDLYNGKQNIYTSVYYYDNEVSNDKAVIDKIFLDFDYDKNLIFFDDVKKVATYLKENNIKFSVIFSGRGFHIYVFTYIEELKNSKIAIKKYVKELHKKTNTSSDPAVIGDLRRVSRLVGTVNIKTGLYCKKISYENLMKLSYKEICEDAKRYVYDKSTEDGSKISLKEYDEEKQSHYCDLTNIKKDFQFNEDFPQCINHFMQDSNLGYKERGELIVYLRDMGYGIDEILYILKSFLSEDKYNHCVFEEKQLYYLFEREDILFSSCQTLKANGYCSSEKCSGNNLYL